MLILGLRTIFLVVHASVFPPNSYKIFIETANLRVEPLQFIQGTHYIPHDDNFLIGAVKFQFLRKILLTRRFATVVMSASLNIYILTSLNPLH